jgi:hypothetical protein
VGPLEIECAGAGWEVSDEIEHGASIIACKICIFSARWRVIKSRAVSDPNSGPGARSGSQGLVDATVNPFKAENVGLARPPESF